jgi:hypothetical protein
VRTLLLQVACQVNFCANLDRIRLHQNHIEFANHNIEFDSGDDRAAIEKLGQQYIVDRTKAIAARSIHELLIGTCSIFTVSLQIL